MDAKIIDVDPTRLDLEAIVSNLFWTRLKDKSVYEDIIILFPSQNTPTNAISPTKG